MGWVVNAKPRKFWHQECSGTHYIGGRVNPTAGLDGWEKFRPLAGFDPRTLHPVSSRYTDYAIPAHLLKL